MRIGFVPAILVCAATAVGGELPSFDVASVKRASHDDRVMSYGTYGGVISYRNLTMQELIVEAYSIKSYQISGPAWLDSQDLRYVVEARCPGDTPENRVRLMLRSLLAERFGLVLHREKKELPVYALLVDTRGPKLKRTTKETPGGFSNGSTGAGTISGDFFLKDLADRLADQTGRPVVDKTGMEGLFEIQLTWANLDPGGGAIFPALQQQPGLRLAAEKAPIDLLVIDRVERMPVQN